MADDRTTQLQKFIDRLQRGDAGAAEELISHAYGRLQRLARHILHKDFPRLDHVHETDSVLDQTAMRLLQALRSVRPRTVKDFLNFTAHKMRQVLIEMADHFDRVHLETRNRLPDEDSAQLPPFDVADTTVDPVNLSEWTEFHKQVENLPEDERETVNLHWYQGLTLTECAKVFGISPKEASRRWRRALSKLSKWLPRLDQRLED